MGRTKGGLNSKRHAVCDGKGRPLVMQLSAGQMSDYKGAAMLLPLAVASSGSAAFVRLSLQALSLDQLFDTVVTVEDVAAAKPAPDLFLEAARRLRVAPDDCLVFEDSAQGVQAAKAAGCRVVEVADLVSQNQT